MLHVAERAHAGRVFLVTGAAGGIGAACARLLAAEGAAVVLADATAGVDTVVEEVVAAGGEAVSVRADVTSAGQMESAVETAVSRFGGLDALVAAAGVQAYGSATSTEESEFDRVLGVNVKGVFLAAKAALPQLRGRPGAAIVVVSSVQASIAQTEVVAYSASKGALNAMVRAMAIDEIGNGVRVNAVCPASVDTPMLRASARSLSDGTDAGAERLVAEWGRAHPIGRVASPAEVAAVVSFLAGDRASFMTGEDVRVDGGLLASVGVALPDEEGR